MHNNFYLDQLLLKGIKWFLLINLFLLSLQSLAFNINSDRDSLSRVYETKSEYYASLGNYDSSEYFVRKRIKRSKIVNDIEDVLYGKRELIKIAIRRNRVDSLSSRINNLLTEIENEIGLKSELYLNMLLTKGHYFMETDQLDSALAINNKILLAMQETEVDSSLLFFTYNNLGVTFTKLDRQDKAIDSYEKAATYGNLKDRSDSVGYAILLANIGATNWRIYNYASAIDYFKKILEMQTKHFLVDHPATMVAYQGLSACYEAMSKYDQALSYNSLAIALAQKLYGKTNPYTLLNHSNGLVILSTSGDITRLKLEAERLLILLEETNNLGSKMAMKIYNNLGASFLDLGKMDSAKFYFTKVTEIAKQNGFENSLDYASISLNLFLYYKDTDQKALANETKDKIIAIYKSQLPVLSPKLNRFYNTVSMFYSKYDELDSAIYYNDLSLKSNLIDPSLYSDNYKPKIEDIKDKLYAVYYYTQQLTIRKKANQDLDEFTLSFVLQLMDYLRENRLYLRNYQYYANAEERFSLLYQQHLKDTNQLAKLLQYLEARKGQILVDKLLNSNKYDLFSRTDQTRLISTIQRRDYYEDQYVKFQNDSVLAPEYLKLRNVYNLKIDSLKVLDHQNIQLLNAYRIDVDEVMSHLDGQLLIHYTVIDSSYHALCINDGIMDLFKLSPVDEIDSLVKQQRLSLTKSDHYSQNLLQTNYNLYEALLKPIIDKYSVENLVVSATRSLHRLNFDALSIASDQYTPALSAFSFRIVYSYTLTKISRGAERPSKILAAYNSSLIEDDISKIAIGGFSEVTRSGYNLLRGAAEETQNLSEEFNGDLFKNATKTTFINSFHDYKLTHVASHAVSDDIFKKNTGILFNRDKSDTLDNGFLSLAEISTLNASNNELIFLSACNTGAGGNIPGEGLQSIAYAFMYAGSSSIIMTQWRISDETTPEIVGYFYNNLKEGMTKSEALRQAKLNYLTNQKDPLKRHPYFWAGFVLIGDDGPVDIGTSSALIWYILGGIFLTLIMALVVYRARTSKN